MAEYVAADQAVTEEDGVVRLVLTVDADPPIDGDWHVRYLAPIKVESGQAASVQIHWRGSQQ